MADVSIRSRRQVRYVVRWNRLSELIALAACAGLWLNFLFRGG
jgi:hypothetical protein